MNKLVMVSINQSYFLTYTQRKRGRLSVPPPPPQSNAQVQGESNAFNIVRIGSELEKFTHDNCLHGRVAIIDIHTLDVNACRLLFTYIH